MSIIERLHAEHKARLIRLNAVPRAALPIIAAFPVIPEPGSATLAEALDQWPIAEPTDHPKWVPIIVRIKREVAIANSVTVAQIDSPSRASSYVRPRQIAMYLSKIKTRHSLPDIARRFGGRDHTTVIHAVRKIGRLIQTDPELAAEISAIWQRVEEAQQGSRTAFSGI